VQVLNPESLKLKGRILIEASAGTGKTYTIGHLFIRLLIEEELSVDQILVVTFTQAAIEELRDRLRHRLRQTLDALQGIPVDDELLQRLAKTITDVQQKKILLTDALTRMDEAAIFTIHSFCQRMLQDHALESGAPFTMELLKNEQRLQDRAIEDFWRQHFYPASAEYMQWVTSLWKNPQELLQSLNNALKRSDAVFLPPADSSTKRAAEQKLNALYKELQNIWQHSANQIIDLLNTARKNKHLSSAKDKYHPERMAQAEKSLRQFFTGNPIPYQLPETLILFTTDKINKSLLKKAAGIAPTHAFFTLFATYYKHHRNLVILRRAEIILTARNFVVREVNRCKQDRAQLSFDDVLRHFDAALQGRGGKILAQTIGQRFPVIMVDEFQDTDPLQYRIFSTIHAASRKHSLFLIGDPKQAIYGFRGADIFTYLQAKKETELSCQLTMKTNYRASSAMVEAVNQLFNRDNPFILCPGQMEFYPVDPGKIADQTKLLINAKSPDPLQCLLLPESSKKSGLSKQKAREYAVLFCAHEIATLLKTSQQGKATLGSKAVAAGDIAILVRTHREAEQMRRALGKLNIASVYLSRDSVFLSNEAEQFVSLLLSLIDPGNSARLCTTLATELFGWTALQLDELRRNEHRWEETTNVITSYSQLCKRSGFFTMFQQLLADQEVVSRIVADEDGERKLTNFLHLADLLQNASQQLAGTEHLLRWLLEQIEASDLADESRQLRLESDENLVTIVTIHKAKGLEYPIVFLPFLWSAHPCNKKQPFSFHRRDNPEQLLIDLGTGDDLNYQRAEKERLAEDMRLLYVAFTRAKYCCYYCWGKISSREESALFHLLKLPAKSAAPLQVDKPWPASFEDIRLKPEKVAAKLSAASFKGTIKSSWQITSYSRLTSYHDPHPERPDYDQDSGREEQSRQLDSFGFPKGAAAGTCLHTIFEQISFTDTHDHDQVVTAALQNAGFDARWKPVVLSWLQQILHTPIETDFSLNMLDKSDRLNEMAFYFPLQSVDMPLFNQILQKYSFAPLPDNHSTLEGLMVGFIDLVFRHKNTYYLADYKSNHLGNQPDAYSSEHLHNAMLQHRYDLQYLIYTLALHRFLRQKISAYSYEQYFGGIFYLFIRGMNPAYQAETGVYTVRPTITLIDELDLCFADNE